MVFGSVRIRVLSADMVCGISEGEGPWLLGWKPNHVGGASVAKGLGKRLWKVNMENFIIVMKGWGHICGGSILTCFYIALGLLSTYMELYNVVLTGNRNVHDLCTHQCYSHCINIYIIIISYYNIFLLYSSLYWGYRGVVIH